MRSWSTSKAWFSRSARCSAFATADWSTLWMCFAASFFEKRRIAYASGTARPRIWSITRRIGFLLLRRALSGVTPEQSRRRELTDLVSDHVLGDVDGDELVPVVHRERVAHEVGRDGAAPRPRLEHLLLVLLVEHPDFFEERRLHVRAFLDRASHLLRRLPALASAHDEFGGWLPPVPRLLPFNFAPRRRGRTPAGRLPFAAPKWVVDRVHRHAAHARPTPEPPGLAGLPHREELVLGVRDLADGGEALTPHHPHFGRAQPQRDVVPFLRDDLHTGAGRARQLTTTPDLELYVVHGGAERDLEQRHRVPDPDVRAGPRHDPVAHGEPLGRQDVALLAVRIVEQRDARGPVRVVLEDRKSTRL